MPNDNDNRPNDGGANAVADLEAALARGDIFTEGGHKQATDVNTEEVISTVNGLAAKSALVASDSIGNIAIQALQNAVETANMISKQAVRHSDLAINYQWTMDAEAAAVILFSKIADAVNTK